MATNCLVDCVKALGSKTSPREVLPGDSMSPWVMMKIQGEDGSEITVGNESSPRYGNSAIIKSMQHGSSNNAGVILEIHDEQGGAFEKFTDKLNKCMSKATEDYKLLVQWGWINTECGSTSGEIISKSPCFKFLPMGLEASYTDGRIKFTITGGTLTDILIQARASKIYDRMTLKQAIRALMGDTEYCPTIKNVYFKRRNQEEPWNFSPTYGNGGEGPVGDWKATTQNKLSAAMSWIEPFRTDREKGISAAWDYNCDNPGVIFWEDPKPKPGEAVDWETNSRGTYIVNGGKCSPVISFTPNAKWTFDILHRAGGNMGGGINSKALPQVGREDGNEANGCEGAGTQTAIANDEQGINIIGVDFGAEARRSGAEHEVAAQDQYHIQAEMRIQGDPEFSGPFVYGGNIAILVINPFHITNIGGCGDWLAYPPCSPVFSNKAWLVDGVDHSIREGTYVTTVKVRLAAPGADLNKDDPFGGANSGGWKPPTRCGV